MIVSDSGGTTFAPCPAGSYLARCCRLVDIGTVQTDYQGEAKTAHKVMLSFEVLDPETRRDDGAPFVLSKRYTMSLHEKAALRKELASWRGRDFTPDELRGFDLRNILGKECFISVVETAKGDRTYSNIASIMKPPRGMVVPQGCEPVLYWDMSAAEPDWQVFAQLHPKLAAQIALAPEFARLNPPKSVSLAPTAPAPAPQAPQAAPAPQHTAPRPAPRPAPAVAAVPAGAAAGSGFDDMDDDIPF